MTGLPVAWRLTEGTYWRQSSGDAFIANENGVLRLNPASAALFLVLLGVTPISEVADLAELEELRKVLIGQRMIEVADSPADPDRQRLEPLPGKG